MLFIYPMWDSESQRIGKRKCTPLGYHLHGIAEVLGFFGLLILVGVVFYLGYRYISASLITSHFLLVVIPFSLGVIAEVLYYYSWKLAKQKGFHYDRETGEASWTEKGERRTYKYESNPMK